ncbi:MAG TPA: nucleotidyltransferase domain-containing protein [Longimicrobiales bacterium]|nr:nucleotidyltransferase domain-containing protein [Longimicrobiales bacterium]
MVKPMELAERFVTTMAGELEGGLRSALVYGSVARGDAIPGVSDVNILLLLDSVTMETLEQLSPLARGWAEQGNTAPLLLDWESWGRAADVFSVEVSDMLEHRRLIRGEDPLDGVRVQPRSLRAQTERELRGKLIQLHEGLLLAAPEPDRVGELLLAALPSFATYFRATLRLAARPVPATTPETIAATAVLVGGDAGAFQEAWQARAQGHAPALRPTDGTVRGYYALVQRVTEHVDRLLEETQ